MYGHGMGFAGWWGIGIAMLLFWAVVIAVIVLLVRWATGNRRTHDSPPAVGHGQGPPMVGGPPPEAHRILDERFARGEIDEEEYRRRRDLLRGG